LGEWEQARRDYDTCLELDPGNKSVVRAKSKLQKIIARQDEKDKKRYKNLFSRLSDIEQTEVNQNPPQENVQENIDEHRDENPQENPQVN